MQLRRPHPLRAGLLAIWLALFAVWPGVVMSYGMPSAAHAAGASNGTEHHHSAPHGSHKQPCDRCCDLCGVTCGARLVRPGVSLVPAAPVAGRPAVPASVYNRPPFPRSYPLSPLPLGPPVRLS
jgi:hypothetical protein